MIPIGFIWYKIPKKISRLIIMRLNDFLINLKLGICLLIVRIYY